MTAFVIDLRSDKLTIGSDTLGYAVCSNTAPLGFVSKVFTIPRLRCALFGRGIMEIPARVAVEMMLSPHVRTFAEAAEALPALLRAATQDYASRQGVEDADSTQIFEACFGGWDTEARRMRVLTLYNYHGYVAEELPAGTAGTMTMPVLPPEFAPSIAGLGLEKRLTAGLHACRAYFEAHPERTGGLSLVGGEIEMTAVTAAGINISTIGRFADYEQDMHAGAAVVARYQRGELAADVRDGLVRADEMFTADGAPPAGNVVAAPTASRAERRRAEKEARKSGRRAA